MEILNVSVKKKFEEKKTIGDRKKNNISYFDDDKFKSKFFKILLHY